VPQSECALAIESKDENEVEKTSFASPAGGRIRVPTTSKPMRFVVECNQKRDAGGDDISMTRQLQLNQAPPSEQEVHV